MFKTSLILSWKDVEAVSRIEKQSSEHKALHVSDPLMYWKICEFVSHVKCSRTRVARRRFVSYYRNNYRRKRTSDQTSQSYAYFLRFLTLKFYP